jgi:hypothetical protein
MGASARMKIACRVVAIASLIGILVSFLLLQTYGSLFNGVVEVSAETQSLIQFFIPLFFIVAATASALSFVSGVMGMVMAGQRRQRTWFVLLLVALVFETYGSLAIILIPFARQALLGDSFNGYIQSQTLNYVITPLFAPLVALLYSLRAQGSPQAPANTKELDDDSSPIGLEYSRLDDAPTG